MSYQYHDLDPYPYLDPWSGSPPNFNHLFAGPLPTFSKNFTQKLQIHSEVFAQNCYKTNKQWRLHIFLGEGNYYYYYYYYPSRNLRKIKNWYNHNVLIMFTVPSLKQNHLTHGCVKLCEPITFLHFQQFNFSQTHISYHASQIQSWSLAWYHSVLPTTCIINVTVTTSVDTQTSVKYYCGTTTITAYTSQQQRLENSKKYKQWTVLHVLLHRMETADEMDMNVWQHRSATDHSMIQCVCNRQSDAVASHIYNPDNS